MTPAEVIARKRDGLSHEPAEIEALVRGATDGSWAPEQLAAWLMAAYLNGLDEEETATLTLAMAASGERLDLSSLPRPAVDKHSTGGIGDKTTLVLLPLLAACGLCAVKMSGRGLGITGGTIDKLESIPGFRTDLSPPELLAQAARIGLALAEPTLSLAPADKTLYALRDVTATVGSIPLITASILSKKIAGGAPAVVLDVKCGSGAFMKDLEAARRLRGSLERVGERAGLRVRALITAMDRPLGRVVGNALEVAEAVDTLRGGGPSDLRALALRFAAEALVLAGLAPTLEGAAESAERALARGRAAEIAQTWIEAQGGDPNVLLRPDRVLPRAPVEAVLAADRPGWIAAADAGRIGTVAMGLGAGRVRRGDPIDPAVGILLERTVGDPVEVGQPLARVYARSEERARAALEPLGAAFALTDEPIAFAPLILDDGREPGQSPGGSK